MTSRAGNVCAIARDLLARLAQSERLLRIWAILFAGPVLTGPVSGKPPADGQVRGRQDGPSSAHFMTLNRNFEDFHHRRKMETG